MGNYHSCCGQNTTTATLMDSHGNLRQIEVPVKAAELMLDKPNHVVSLVYELRRTKRIVAMRPDDQLLPGKLYFLVPLSRVNAKISESELEMMDFAATSCEKKMTSSKKQGGGGKVMPAKAAEMRDGEVDGGDKGFNIYDRSSSSGSYRHWTPVLESIPEECWQTDVQ